MLSAQRIFKSFERPVLRGCALQLSRGQITGLIGPPAAGKSLLLRILAGLVEPDAGSVLVDGVELVQASRPVRLQLQAKLGMAFQNIALFDHLSVFENLAFPLQRRGLHSEPVLQERVARQLKAVGLSGFEERPVTSLSGGQKRRIGLARATITQPSLLLCDEPAAGLDPVSSSRIFALLRQELRNYEVGILVVSSDVQRLLTVCDNLAYMEDGIIRFHGSVAEFWSCRHPGVRAFAQACLAKKESR